MQKYLKLLDDKLRGRTDMQPGDIRYAGLNIRLLANMLDMIFIMVVLTAGILLFMPKPDFANLYSKTPPEVMAAFEKYGAHQITPEEFKTSVMPYYMQAATKLISALLLQIAICGIIFVGCWKRWNATPGKMVFGLKIVDAITFGNPTTSQYIIRFFGYVLATIPAGLGFAVILFNKRRRGLHDMMADTAVVFSRAYNPEFEKKKIKWQVTATIIMIIIAIIILSNRK